jgi:molybdopterin synthase catalytic subunit
MRDSCNISIRIETSDFNAGSELQSLYQRNDGSLGAVVTFIGLVRDRHPEVHSETHPEGKPQVQSLHLEHYPGMTEKSIEKIVQEAIERWPLEDVLVVHRVGRLEPNSQIVYVQVASAHRDAAFSGAEFIMDYLKTDAVLWKREAQADVEHWVEATQTDRERRDGWQGSSD